MDEGYEALTLMQTGKSRIMPLVLIDAPGEGYWRTWDEHIRAYVLRNQFISPDDLHLYDITDSAEGGVLLLKSARNTVSDNHIHHCGAVYKHIGGVILEGALRAGERRDLVRDDERGAARDRAVQRLGHVELGEAGPLGGAAGEIQRHVFICNSNLQPDRNLLGGDAIAINKIITAAAVC